MDSTPKPPDWADQILEFFCGERHLDEIQGDLHEWFQYHVQKEGLQKARRGYIFDVLRSLRFHRLKSRQELQSSLNHSIMFSNYLKTTWRLLYRNKVFTLINILGLSLGIAACLLCYIYIQEERSFDKFHAHFEDIYRVNRLEKAADGTREKSSVTAGLLAPTLKSEYAEIEDAVRFLPWFDDMVLSNQDLHILAEEVMIADSNFFQFFDFELVQGNPATVLSRPSSVILSEELAAKLFGRSNPIGQTVKGLAGLDFEVTGITKKAPKNSHFNYDALISYSSTIPGQGPLNFSWMNRWFTQVAYTYVRLNPNTSQEQIEGKLTAFMEKYQPDEIAKFDMYLQPLAEVYMGSNDINHIRKAAVGNPKYIFILTAVALFLLLIGCFNYINISTAKATQRGKEIGIRKVFGAHKFHLMQQFFGEALLLTFLSTIIAILVLFLFLPIANQILQKELNLHLLLHPLMLGGILGLSLLVALLSGTYPAIAMASLKIKAQLGSGFRSRASGGNLRRFLSVVQFGIAISLIAFTILVFQQTKYLQNRSLGFNKDQVIVLDLPNELRANYLPFKNKLAENPNILTISNSQTVPGSPPITTYISDNSQMQNQVEASFWRIDFNFLETYGIELENGRFFDTTYGTDSNAIVINEALAKSLGFDEKLDKQIYFDETTAVPVLGVVKDFNYESLYSKISPMFFSIGRRTDDKLSLKINHNDLASTLADIKVTWEQFETRYPFSYQFLDEEFASFYKAEQRLLKAISFFAFLCIIIACLGLYGLTLFNVNRLKREIGIRKVLGAEIAHVLQLISKENLLLFGIAFVAATPVTWLLMNRWLNDFPYRVDIAWWMFALAGLLVLAIAILTVSYQSIKAAVANPIKILRHE